MPKKSKYYQGFFKPKHPEKYQGDPTSIVYRSGWELTMMMWLDNHPDIIKWCSENVVIPYVSPLDNKVHRYFVDLWIKKKDKNGKTQCLLIEIKPKNQTKQPVIDKNNRSKRYLREVTTWMLNSAKWSAAEKYCAERNWQWIIMTEDNMFKGVVC